jgi:hypothetical protein
MVYSCCGGCLTLKRRFGTETSPSGRVNFWRLGFGHNSLATN